MILFNNAGGHLFGNKTVWLGNYTITDVQTSRTIFSGLFGEERPRDMLILLSILVFLLHIYGFMWLMRSDETPTPIQQPRIMEVSMIAMSSPKPAVAPKPPTPRPPEKKPLPAKIQPKPLPKPVLNPIVKKAPPVLQKPADFAPTEPAVEAPAFPPISTQSAPVSEAKPTEKQAEHFTEASYRANYLHNPAPEYPSLAKSREWQGKVTLRVLVSAEGLSDKVEVERSSGHEILDDAAIEAVKKWKFVPAKRGETAVSSPVIVPIVFSLLHD